jgi:hypothetical protein
VRLQPCQTGIVDLLCLTMVLDVLAYALGDLAQASAEGYRYLATAPALLAAIAASAIAERSLLAPRVRWLVVATVSLLLVANQWHALGQGALGLPSRTAAQWNRLQQEPSTDSLLASCARLGTNHLWGNYWLSYRLTFLSGETVIVAPADGIDRYPQYTRLVRDDAMRGYVATGGDSMLPVWRRLTGYREWVIGNYHLFTIRRPSDSAPGHGPGSSTRD